MIGIDEVGRGCWAGPLLVVAARQKTKLPLGLNDSKKLSKKRRESLKFDIEITCELGEGWVTAVEIDAFGLSHAMKLGVSRALDALQADTNEEIMMDGLINYCAQDFVNVRCEAKADGTYGIVSAASIYAKVTRDTYMADLKAPYTVYEFSKHVGYGTALHMELLKQYGVSDQHRLSFAPVRKFVTV